MHSKLSTKGSVGQLCEREVLTFKMLGVNQEDEVTIECLEEMESLHNMQTPFPFFDLNGGSHTVRSKFFSVP